MQVKSVSYFKTCRSCLFKWGDLNDFLGDPEIKIIGYQVNYDDLSAGVFLFNHSCGNTLGLPVRSFNGLYEGPVFRERAKGTAECPEYCLYQDQLDRCQVRCECAYVRDIIYIIRNWPKY